MSNQIGVITEQGFVAGNGLGFNKLNEEDSNKIKDSLKNSTKKPENTSKAQ